MPSPISFRGTNPALRSLRCRSGMISGKQPVLGATVGWSPGAAPQAAGLSLPTTPPRPPDAVDLYQVGLPGAGYDEVGFSFPGMPFVVIGHNRRSPGDHNSAPTWQDLTSRSSTIGASEALPVPGWLEGPFTVRREEIASRASRTLVLDLLETLHGRSSTMRFPELQGAQGSPPTSIPRPALEGTHLIDSLAALNLAEDWPSFHRRARRSGTRPSVNFVYATPRAHRLPVDRPHPHRAPGHQGLVPVPGWDGPLRMAGLHPLRGDAQRLRSALGLPSPPPTTRSWATFPHFIAYDMADPYRAQRITDLLAAGHDFTRDGFATSRPRPTGLQAAAIRPYLLARAARRRARKEGARRGPPLGSPLRAGIGRRLGL